MNVNVDPEDLVLKADIKLVEQVLINLVQNSIYALEFIENPEITLNAYRSKGHTFIEVRDNGRGIDEEHMDSIFIPFFSTREGGSGIGLSFVRQVMRLHRGEVSVYSQKREGSNFVLRF